MRVGLGSTHPKRVAWLAAGLLVISACTAAPTGQTPSSEATPTATPEPTEAPTATPSASPSATATPAEPSAPGDAECESEPPTAMSEDWEEHTGSTPDYRFSTPADWVDMQVDRLEITQTISPETLETIGFPEFAVVPVDLFREEDGSIGVSAWAIESNFGPPTDEFFDAELAWLEGQPQIVEVLDDTLEACIDGSTALGFSSTWAFPDRDRYVEIYMLERNGKLYQTQVTANDEDEGSETFEEILRTWEWTEPLEDSGGGDGPAADGDIAEQLAATDFRIAGVMTGFEEADWPDGPPPLSEYEDVFGDDEQIFVIYQLDPGVADTVTVSWHLEGELQTEGSFDYLEDHTYAWAWINPASGGFELGSYEVVLELEESGDRMVIPFEVEDR